MGAVYVFDDVLSGGSTPLSLSAGVLLVSGHGFMPAGQLTGPHRHSLTASCRLLAACAAGAQADSWKEKRVLSLKFSGVCVMLQRKSQPCTPWGQTTNPHFPPSRWMQPWSRSRQPQRLSQTARTRLRVACCSATMHRWLFWASDTWTVHKFCISTLEMSQQACQAMGKESSAGRPSPKRPCACAAMYVLQQPSHPRLAPLFDGQAAARMQRLRNAVGHWRGPNLAG